MLKNKLLVTNNSSVLKNLLLAFFACILLDNVALAQATFSVASGSSATGCAPLTVNFTGSCPGCTNFVITGWSASPGSINSPTATLTFPNAGTFSVTMSYTINGVPGTTSQPNFVTAYPNPIVDFSTPSTTVCQGQTACFTPNITSGTAPFTYTWVAGQSSSAANPCFTYNSAGSYTVSLTVTDTHGCTGTKSVPSYLNVPVPPDATFTTTYTAGQCTPPVTASFLWTGTPQNASYTHSWDFGSAPTSTASGNPAVNHTYNAVGVYDVTHIVTNAGCADTVTVPGAVVIGINPIPAIIINDTTPCHSDQINAQCPTGGFTYAWTSTAGLVGTSGPPTNFSATITCTNTGNQTITCTMTQAVTGCTATVVKNIFVDPGPQFVIVADDTADCAPPFTVKFHLEDGAGNCISNLQPSWLNPTPVTLINGTCPQYQYTYTTAGNFDVSALATNSSGCSGAITQTNYIHIQSPLADFIPTQVDPVLICAGQSVQFTDMSVPVTGVPIISWAWSFTANGNTTTSSLPNPIKTFNAITGLNNYNVTVTLVVTDANGCTSTKTYNACVKVGSHLNFSLLDFIQVGGNTALCGTQTISYQASIALNNPPFPPGVNILWQYYNPNSTPPYTSSAYSTGINGIMTFNPDSLGPFCVRMVVNNNGCKDTTFKCNQFTMSGPIAKFSSSPDINCSLPALYTFQDTSIGLSGAPLNNVWKIYDMNNGGTLITPPVTNQVNFSYTFTSATLIKVVLVRTEGSCTDSISKFINVTETRADFTASDTTICIGSPIGFTPDIQTGLNYTWNFGIGGSNTAMTPFYTYPLPGAYNVMLAVSGNGGVCNDTAYKTILVNGSKVNIMEAANDTISCFPAPAVNLIGNIQTIYPSGTPISIWSWGFSDGGTANGQNVNHVFTTSNFNYAYLYATDANGCTSGDTLRFVMPDPQADFIAPTTTSCAGQQLLFASTSVGINGSTLSYIWNYGVGPNTVSSPQDTSYYTYTANNIYDVSLFISDIYGCKDTIVKPGYVTITPFIADYTVSDTFKSCPTLNVLCTPSSLSGHTIDTTTLQWILYDNPPPASISYITSQYSPTIPITVPGLYTLSLVIQSSTGCKDTVQKNNLIHVLGPKTDFTVTPPKACPGATISLQAINGTSDIISYSWLLTGGVSSNTTNQNASVTYNTPGVYFPIIVVNNGICTVTMPAADSVIIVNPPKASFTVSDTIVCVPDNIQFTDTSVPGDGLINGWNWDLGLGTSTIKNPTQNYAIVGLYPITLIVTDANGCKDTASKNVSAIQNLQPSPVSILRTSVVNNNQIAIGFAPYNNVNNDFGQYLLYRSVNGGVPALLASIPNIANTTYLDNSVSTPNNCYEYLLKVENGCGNISNFSAPSSASCLSASPLAGAIKITWTPYLGWSAVNKYNVYRVYDYDTTTHILLASVSGNAANLTYTDSISIRCLDPISYRIEAIQTGTGVNAWSDTTVCSPLVASVNAQVHVNVATVENNAVKVTWDKPQNVRYLQEYYVEKDTTFMGSFYPIGTAIPASSTLAFIDTDVNVARRPYTYRITGKDSCNNFLQSGRTGTSMVLTATPIASRIRLNWTPYSLWKNGVLKYRIQLFNASAAIPEWVTIDSVAGNVLAYEDEEIRFALSQNCYRIVAVEKQGGKSISMSNESCGALEPVIFTPTAFTPNGDNVNDFFIIKGTFVTTYHIRIYNKLGQMVYESNDLTKGWDGKINGTDCPEGTYVYHVEIISSTGEKKQKAGSITLIR